VKLITTRGGEKQERELDEREHAEALREIFGITRSA
jgi:hypothetical protein